MSEEDLHDRVRALEAEVRALRVDPGGSVISKPAGTPLRRLGRFLVTYWVLISFFIAILTAVYVRFRYEIDFFETYANTQIRKDLAEVHRHLGDELMGAMEWEAASGAYRRALEFDPHSSAAAYGVVKAQVFEPLPGQQYVPDKVIATKLEYLSELLPDDDYQIVFMRGVHAWLRQDPERASALVRQAIAIRPQFAGGHVFLGLVAQETGDIPGAIASFEAAVSIAPDDPDAQNNLGFARMLSADFAAAIRHFRTSERLSPRLLTQVNLGDALRLSGAYDQALAVHRTAMANASSPANLKERYAGGAWTYNFMPLGTDDTQTILRYVRAQTPEQKLAIAQFALSLDHALQGAFDEADRYFARALELDRASEYRAFFANKIESMEAWMALNEPVAAWAVAKKAVLRGRGQAAMR